MKNRLLKIAIIAVAILVAGYFAPGVYWRLSGTMHGEAFYAGRPTSYWRATVVEDEQRGAAAVGDYFGVPPTTIRGTVESYWSKLWHREELQSNELGKDSLAIPVLRELLRDEDELICNRAFASLLSQGKAAHDDLPALIEFLMNDRLSAARLSCNAGFAMLALSETHGDSLIGPCAKWLTHADPKRVSLAASGIALSGKDGIPLLIKRIEEIDAGRGEVVVVLGDIGPNAKAALPKLREIVRTDKNPETRAKAKQAIAKITSDR